MEFEQNYLLIVNLQVIVDVQIIKSRARYSTVVNQYDQDLNLAVKRPIKI
jgi:hypothetical protein